jgi:hypothetical protein
VVTRWERTRKVETGRERSISVTYQGQRCQHFAGQGGGSFGLFSGMNVFRRLPKFRVTSLPAHISFPLVLLVLLVLPIGIAIGAAGGAPTLSPFPHAEQHHLEVVPLFRSVRQLPHGLHWMELVFHDVAGKGQKHVTSLNQPRRRIRG